MKSGGEGRTNVELLWLPALIGIMIIVISFDDFCKGVQRDLGSIVAEPELYRKPALYDNYIIAFIYANKNLLSTDTVFMFDNTCAGNCCLNVITDQHYRLQLIIQPVII